MRALCWYTGVLMSLDWFAYGFIFVFGAIIGSFLNAVSFRFNTGRTLGGRSACMTCSATIRARDLIPIVSYLLLSGKCRACRARISLQYPLVELAAGAVATQCYRLFADDTLLFSFSFLVWMLLLFIVVYDVRHTIIPDSCAFVLGIFGLVSIGLSEGGELSRLLAGPLLALPLFALSFFSKGRAMGWGDGKLMLGLGWFLGPLAGFTALLFSFWIGTVVSLVLLLAPLYSGKGRFTMKSEIPYAPFLIMGAAAAYFTDATHFVSRILFF
jgi:prepilin signal peptidase PulO-like enzyme (type II secretory pathway)